MDEMYRRKTLAALKRFETAPGPVDLAAYQEYRLQTRDKTLLRFDKFCTVTSTTMWLAPWRRLPSTIIELSK